jgi:uncharacterized protein YbaA (DUF1428 family)
MAYVDGFLIVVPKKKLALYKGIASKAGKIWKELGALEYRECVGDDMDPMPGMGTTFAKRTKAKGTDAVVFSWIVYKSRAHRDSVNKKVMKDPRMQKLMDHEKNPMPFDMKAMSYAGFKVIVDL